MKIIVIGGTGFIGTKVVTQLRQKGHQVIAASSCTGINTITGQGLEEALTNADVVIDLANPISFDEKAIKEFFETSSRNLLAAEIKAGVKHHIGLSIVGVNIMQNLPYMRAKKLQEDLIKESGVQYTVVRSTQFLEFLKGIADQATDGNDVHLSNVECQPIASQDVADFLTRFALGVPLNGIVEIAGPERYPLYEIVALYLRYSSDSRRVIYSDKPTYFGAEVPHTALVPYGHAELGAIRFEKWWRHQRVKV